VGGIRHPQPDDGWRYHPKHVEQFPDTINCVTLHLVGYILECYSSYFCNTLAFPYQKIRYREAIKIIEMM
jgi:hypothetical protein